MKDWAMAVKQRASHKKVVVALARKLAVMMHAIWVSGACSMSARPDDDNGLSDAVTAVPASVKAAGNGTIPRDLHAAPEGMRISPSGRPSLERRDEAPLDGRLRKKPCTRPTSTTN